MCVIGKGLHGENAGQGCFLPYFLYEALVQILRSKATQATSVCVKASVLRDLGLWLKQTSFMYITYSVLCGLH